MFSLRYPGSGRVKIDGLSLDESHLPNVWTRQWILLWAVVTGRGLSPPGEEDSL